MNPLNAAIRRCRRAYRMNNIPWDGTIARLGIVKMNELSAYWEAKVPTTAEEDAFAEHATIREWVEIIRAVQGPPPNGSGRGRAVAQQAFAFHGSLNGE